MHSENNFSIIIPTFREAQNIAALIKRIAKIDFGLCAFEVIIVDDNSYDGIEKVVSHLSRSYPWLQLHTRQGKKSLSAAAMEGFQQAQYPIVILMDADLSHPPEKIKEMITALSNTNADFVIGSRYVQGGSADEIWPVSRRITSHVSALIARVLILSNIKDPLSGFFAVRKETLASGDPLKPIGWKIGLEIMLKCRCCQIKEIPIHFSERLYGKSKLNVKIAFDYLRHVNRLVLYKIFSYF